MKTHVKIYAALIVLAITLLPGCSKDNLFDCFTGAGKIVTEQRTASPFGGIVLNNNLDLYITQGPDYSISVEAGKNLQKNIKTEINDGVLTISNENTCNWVRSYDKPMNVYITCVDLDSIIYQSSGNIHTLNTLTTDSIKVLVKEGAGLIDMNINTHKSYFQLNEGTVDLEVRGYSDVVYLSSNSYGLANCLDLQANFIYMSSGSTNDCYVQVNLEFLVVIENVGNVYYTGDPGTLEYTRNSSGELIKLN